MSMLANMNTDMRDWLLEHHKAAYQFQLERSEKLRDRVSLLSGLLTLLGGALLYTSINYPHSWRGGWSLFFYGPGGLALILFLVVIWQVLYSLGWGFQYSYIPTPRQLQDYVVLLKAYADASPGETVDVLADAKNNMIQAYCTGATHNLSVNTRRSNVLLRATQIAIVSFGLLLVSLPRFFFDSAHKDSEPTKVIISEPIHIRP